ncbi:hypothetical protein IV203_037243 [Nitzschia inconspicua]|uniref:Uncharacterized protein n=1 Tax=Nitzschia inconspicua TaxID=303405 RepID=A0A9K3LNK6_9STRA|nr:hypothetical protein IV203_006565 [Nitzschia inconspicua]KAG7364041.1 hypothetical protein IV203_037243 [Nitzschia inconspicua]
MILEKGQPYVNHSPSEDVEEEFQDAPAASPVQTAKCNVQFQVHNACITSKSFAYTLSSKSAKPKQSIIDKANGGIVGQDCKVIRVSDRTMDIQNTDNHHLDYVLIGTVARCIAMGREHSIHSPGQLKLFKHSVYDKSHVGGTQRIKTTDGYIIHIATILITRKKMINGLMTWKTSRTPFKSLPMRCTMALQMLIVYTLSQGSVINDRGDTLVQLSDLLGTAVVDVNHDGCYNTLLVANGHLTDAPLESVHSVFSSTRDFRIVKSLGKLNDPAFGLADIRKTHLGSCTWEDAYTIGCDSFHDDDRFIFKSPNKYIPRMHDTSVRFFVTKSRVDVYKPLEKGNHHELDTLDYVETDDVLISIPHQNYAVGDTPCILSHEIQGCMYQVWQQETRLH